MDVKRIRNAAVIVGSFYLLTACSNSEKNIFVDQCIAKENSKDVCECTYDMAKDSLEDDQFEFFAAAFLEDTSRQAKARSSLGFLGLASAAAKIAWLTPNLDAACTDQ